MVVLNVERTVRRLYNAVGVFDGARLRKDVVLVDGVTQRIAHGLGKPIQGYIVVGIRNNAAAGYLSDEHDGRHGDTSKFMYIRADGFAPTVDLVVF